MQSKATRPTPRALSRTPRAPTLPVPPPPPVRAPPPPACPCPRLPRCESPLPRPVRSTTSSRWRGRLASLAVLDPHRPPDALDQVRPVARVLPGLLPVPQCRVEHASLAELLRPGNREVP